MKMTMLFNSRYTLDLRGIFRPGLIMTAALGIASGSIVTPATAQSMGTGGMTLDGRAHPGSPITGWTGNISPSDPYSAGPNMGAWITRAGLIHSRAEVGVGELDGKVYVLGGYADGN